MQTDNLLAAFSAIMPPAQAFSGPEKAKANSNPAQGQAFDRLLRKEIDKQAELKFSKHAETRMAQRDMRLSDEDLQKLSGAVDKAGQKGVQNTLVVMNGMAFVVNVPGNVVITAMKGRDLKENTFTQIDGAVIV